MANAAELTDGIAPLVTDRPTDSVSPIVVPKGSLQFEGGYKYSRLGSNNASRDLQTFPELLLRYGLGERYELRLFASGWNVRKIDNKTEENFSDITIGSKIELLPANGNWAISSVLVDVSLPTGATGETNDYVIPKVLYLGGYQLTERFGLTYNIGPSLITFKEAGERETRWDLNYSLALSATVRPDISVFAEVYGAVIEGSTRNRSDVQVGTTIMVAPLVQLDFRVGAGLTSASPDWFTGAGLAFRIP
jgi:hypothetical protein